MSQIKQLFSGADPIQDHLVIKGIDEGWMIEDSETLEKYGEAKQRMNSYEDYVLLRDYFTDYADWLFDAIDG